MTVMWRIFRGVMHAIRIGEVSRPDIKVGRGTHYSLELGPALGSGCKTVWSEKAAEAKRHATHCEIQRMLRRDDHGADLLDENLDNPASAIHLPAVHSDR